LSISNHWLLPILISDLFDSCSVWSLSNRIAHSCYSSYV
jgi:hypothetical protein